MDKLYTTFEVAEMLSVKPTTVLKWIRDGDLKAVRLSKANKKNYRISQNDIDDFLKSKGKDNE